MATTIDRALELFPDTHHNHWRTRGGAAIHRDAIVSRQASLLGGVIRNGEINGGTFLPSVVIEGGLFEGGTFEGGVFHGGSFSGHGVYRGGTFYGGVFTRALMGPGLIIEGGTFHLGRFYGGKFHGGSFRGGVYHFGQYRRGTFASTPLQMEVGLPWTVNVAGPDLVAIGCQCRTIKHWKANLSRIADSHKVQGQELKDVQEALRFAERWFKLNPKTVTK